MSLWPLRTWSDSSFAGSRYCRNENAASATSPFGTRKPLPVYVERTILDLPLIYINGGARGLLVSLAPAVLTQLLGAVWRSTLRRPTT
jgi:hypothetical protein